MCLSVVTITRPPENTTVCRGSNVTISCGYQSTTPLPVTWIINGTSFTEVDIMDSEELYLLNNPTTPNAFSLIVFSINDNTTFQCVVHSTPSATASTLGTVTVIAGTYVCIYKIIIIGMSLSEPHHRRSMVKSVFLLACLRHPLYG